MSVDTVVVVVDLALLPAGASVLSPLLVGAMFAFVLIGAGRWALRR